MSRHATFVMRDGTRLTEIEPCPDNLLDHQVIYTIYKMMVSFPEGITVSGRLVKPEDVDHVFID